MPASIRLGLGSQKVPHVVGLDTLPRQTRLTRIVHISDTHLLHDQFLPLIPDGDIFIHSGDFCNHDIENDVTQTYQEVIETLNLFMAKLPHRHKIFVAGNHELSLKDVSKDVIQRDITNATYLQDDLVTVNGLRIYGSPWNKDRGSTASAFVLPSEEIKARWQQIPDDIDVLVTHSPPTNILDGGGWMGCPELRNAILDRVRPPLHLFGHAHYAGAVYFTNETTLFINGASPSPPPPSLDEPCPSISVIDFYHKSSPSEY